MLHRVPHEVVVAQHDALGLAGRAAGVEEAGQRVAAGAGVLERRALRTRSSSRRRPAVGIVVVEIEHAPTDGICPPALWHVPSWPPPRTSARAGILENVRDLRRGQSGIDRHHRRTQPWNGIQQLVIAIAVQRQDSRRGHPAARRPPSARRRPAPRARPSRTRCAAGHGTPSTWPSGADLARPPQTLSQYIAGLAVLR